MPVTYDQAKVLAELRVRERQEGSPHEFMLDEEQTERIQGGWVFFYDTRRFIEEGDILYRLGGNCPIHVDESGAVEEIPVSVDIDEFLRTRR